MRDTNVSARASHRVRPRVLAALAALLAGPAIGAQSDVAFPAEAYVARRAALSAKVGNAVVVAAGEYLINPGDALIKQDPTFW
jgi:hypothetical protein